MSSRYIGGIVTKNPTALNPALGNAANGIFTMDQYVQQKAAGTWPAYDPYQKYVTLNLHGNGTNGGQNNTFLDSSTNAFSITRNGNTTQGTFTPYGSNWSNYFNGSSDYLTVASNAAFQMSTGDFTIECWVFVANTSNQMIFIDLRGASSTTLAPLLYMTSAGVVNYYTGGSVQITGSAITANTWNHLAVARSGTSTKLFINGIQAGSTYSDSNNYVQSSVYIARASDAAGSYVNGYVSNARVVKGTAVYTSNFTPATSPLTAITNTSLLTCQSNRFIDNSTNAYALTVNGSPSVQRFSPFAPTAPYDASTIGGSGYFDGSGDSLSLADNAAWNMGSGDFTAEGWIYPTSFANEAMIMGQWSGDVGSTTLNWALMFSSGSTGYLRLITSSNGSSVLFDLSTSTFALTLNMWQHIAAVRSGSTFTIYVNGVSRATTTNASALYDATNSFTIGSESNSPGQYFQGYMSNMRVVKGTAVYTGAFTPPTAPVTAVSGTSLLADFTNGSIYDNAMMNDLETVGNAQISTSVKKYGTGSLAFDGSGDYLLAAATPSNRINSTGDFTIEFWAYFNSVASDQRLLAWDNNSSNFVIALYTTSANNLYYYLSSSGSSWNVASAVSMGAIAINTWYHIALVRSGSVFTPYINGVAGTTTSSSATLYASTLPLAIGAVGNGASPYNGYIDDLRITKGYARYTANFTPPTSQLQDQ